MVPPRSTTFTVSTIAPIDKRPKTSCSRTAREVFSNDKSYISQCVNKSRQKHTENVLDGLAAPIDNGMARPRVNTMGPQRSQLRRAALCWLRSANGKTTMIRFLYTLIKSRLMVSVMGSSSVFTAVLPSLANSGSPWPGLVNNCKGIVHIVDSTESNFSKKQINDHMVHGRIM